MDTTKMVLLEPKGSSCSSSSNGVMSVHGLNQRRQQQQQQHTTGTTMTNHFGENDHDDSSDNDNDIIIVQQQQQQQRSLLLCDSFQNDDDDKKKKKKVIMMKKRHVLYYCVKYICIGMVVQQIVILLYHSMMMMMIFVVVDDQETLYKKNNHRIWNYDTTTTTNKNNQRHLFVSTRFDTIRSTSIAMENMIDEGIYTFVDAPFCHKHDQNHHPCTIHFPNAFTDTSCLITLKGHKVVVPPFGGEDVDQNIGNDYDEEVYDNHNNKNKNNLHDQVDSQQQQQQQQNRRLLLSSSTKVTTSPVVEMKTKFVPNQDRIVLITSESLYPNLNMNVSSLSSSSSPFLRRTITTGSSNSNNNTTIATTKNWFLASLFDGHGDYGHYSSHIASLVLPIQLLQKLQLFHNNNNNNNNEYQQQNEQSMIQNITHDEFLYTDQNIAMKSIPHSGTTAITIYQYGTMVTIASSGDSTALLIQWYSVKEIQHQEQQHKDNHNNNNRNNHDTYRILHEAVKHKPGNIIERQRIEQQAGLGHIYIPQNDLESSRVIFSVTMNIPNTPLLSSSSSSQQQQVQEENLFEVQMGIAMSRCLGDQEAKERKLLIPDPTIISIDLQDYYYYHDDDDKDPPLPPNTDTTTTTSTSSMNIHPNPFFVILATDGLFDYLDRHHIITTIGKALYEEEEEENLTNTDNRKRSDKLQKACQLLIEQAKQQWAVLSGNTYRDDISILVKQIEL